MLAALDVPYLAAHPVEFQTLEQWQRLGARPAAGRGDHHGGDPRARRRHRPDGLWRPLGEAQRRAVRATCEPHLSGRDDAGCAAWPSWSRCAGAHVADRKVGDRPLQLPAQCRHRRHGRLSGRVPIPAQHAQRHEGRRLPVDVPATVDALRDRILHGNAARFGAQANVARPHSGRRPCAPRALAAEIEAHWGPAPGRQQSDGASIFVLGAQFGNVFVGVQPAFGYEGDPMRLLFEKGFAPTHAFSAFYR